MEHESLFTATKWEILKLLERKPYSPIALAEALHSSLANVSQQLRLLELAGLVTSKRISNREKGQPRILYSLAGNLSYLIATTDNFVDKKIVQLSERNKIVLKIWFLENPDERHALEKAFWQIEGQLDSITSLAYEGIKKGTPVLTYQGTAALPKSVPVDGAFKHVTLHKASPTGHVLYEATA